MARINFSNLDKVAKDPASESKLVRDSSICLSEFVNLLSNFTDKANSFTECDLALLIKSLQQFLNRRTFTTCKEDILVGDIFNIDFGINYEPEMSYNHPGVIIDIIGDLVFVIPTSTSPVKLLNAYHPITNPNGNWYYYEVDKNDGFAEKCSLILGNICTISKGRLLDKKGHLTCDINDETGLYRNIRKIILTKVFSHEYNKINKQIESLKSQLKNENS